MLKTDSDIFPFSLFFILILFLKKNCASPSQYPCSNLHVGQAQAPVPESRLLGWACSSVDVVFPSGLLIFGAPNNDR